MEYRGLWDFSQLVVLSPTGREGKAVMPIVRPFETLRVSWRGRFNFSSSFGGCGLWGTNRRRLGWPAVSGLPYRCGENHPPWPWGYLEHLGALQKKERTIRPAPGANGVRRRFCTQVVEPSART